MKNQTISSLAISITTIAFFTLFVTVLSGCQTAGATLDAAGDIRSKVAAKEMRLHQKGLCSSNFDEIRKAFGKNEKDWRGILTVCGSDANALDRQ